MKRISVNTAGSNYEVVVAGSLKELGSFCKVSSGIIIAEEALCEKVQSAALGLKLKTVSGGESVKSLIEIEKLYSFFLESGIDKSSVIIAVGGGALTDAVAFAAAGARPHGPDAGDARTHQGARRPIGTQQQELQQTTVQ